MNVGYSLPTPNSGADDPWAGFEWRLDEIYNIAQVALSNGDAGETALRHVTVDDDSVELTYGELRDAVSTMAAMLDSQGIGRNDVVGVCLPQSPELLITQLATFSLGSIVVPLSMLLGDDSLAYSLSQSEANLLVVDNRRHQDLEVALEDVEVTPVTTSGYDESVLGGLAEIVDSNRRVGAVETAPDDPALIMYTSGTTGKPKGVVQGHQYLAGSLSGYQAWFERFGDEPGRGVRAWTPSEWAWAGALFDVVFPTLALGGTVTSRERRSGFDADRSLALVANQGVTHAFLPPTALSRIMSEGSIDEHDLSAFSVVMCGGEKLPGSVFSWAEERLEVTVNEAYGQTEANALIGNCRAAHTAKRGSMGKAYPGHDVLVVDESGEEVPHGEIGEVAVRCPDPVVFLGYHNDETATREKFDGNLFLTGDLAVQDEDGYLWHQGRKDELILTSGYRVSPLEVESVIEADENVADVVVGGVPDEKRGQIVKAYVVPANVDSGEDQWTESLKETVREELGAHKVPRETQVIDEIPQTRSGKADRTSLFEG
ncbi:acyl-CoA synthetase [Haloferax marisrubri]|uniref:AMP-dependent synthetase n=1 Tax=Haloferax marisrubri TaxID=1544719 RepID=A0A2P4NMG4_9EURY|nr:AMP-binding protein [Haloferax marisrubri]POG54291.1 AMP-dependent synthetase [Haloferax marisrubri]